MPSNGNGRSERRSHVTAADNPFVGLLEQIQGQARHNSGAVEAAKTVRGLMTSVLVGEYTGISDRAATHDDQLVQGYIDQLTTNPDARNPEITTAIAAEAYALHELARRTAVQLSKTAVHPRLISEYTAQALEHKAMAERWLMEMARLTTDAAHAAPG